MDPDQKAKTFVKVVCTGLDDRVKGIHVLRMKADEMMQVSGVAMKMGCTKAVLDACVAVHMLHMSRSHAAHELVMMTV